MNTSDAIRKRTSTRAFQDKPVPKAVLEALLETARWSPSGGNAQPWQVAVVTGEAKHRLGEALASAFRQARDQCPDFTYYPEKWSEPYKRRVVSCGAALYGALGIERRDIERRKRTWERNYRFFEAPVGLLFLLDRALAPGFLMDIGIFMQSVMLAAQDLGLATCPQAAFVAYPDIIRERLDLPPHLMVACGMALGYAEENAPENTYRTEREPIDAFTLWYE